MTVIDRQKTVGFIPSSINRLLKGKSKDLTEKNATTQKELEEVGINLLLGQEVEAIHADQKVLHLKNNTTISYDKLILAMESVQTSERIDGADHPAVLTTKTLAESTHSQQELEKSEHILIVGGGQVGLEAADARYIANIFGSNAPRVFNLVGDVEAAEGLSLGGTTVTRLTPLVT